MSQSPFSPPILYYVIEIGGREFPLVIMADGMSQWDDHTGRRSIRHPHHQHLELRAFTGDRHALCQLQNELLEFTLSAAVPQRIFAKAVEMAQKQRDKAVTSDLQGITWAEAKDVTEMDDLLRDFFWKVINPLLSQPIKASTRR
jgi:hypothetical protein